MLNYKIKNTFLGCKLNLNKNSNNIKNMCNELEKKKNWWPKNKHDTHDTLTQTKEKHKNNDETLHTAPAMI